MSQHVRPKNLGRPSTISALVLGAAVFVAACGGSAPATSSVAASVAPPASVAAVTPSPLVTAAPTVAPSTAPTGSGVAAVDPADGLTIGAPYSIAALPPAFEAVFQQQMATSLGAFGGSISVGFRQISGGTGSSILMVIAFPAGSLNDVTYKAAVAGLTSAMGATLTASTVEGIELSSGTAATGSIGLFHAGDHMVMVISQAADDAVPVTTALITANR